MLDQRLIFVTGKGGTGRSAVAASAGLAAAHAGRRTVVFSIADHEGLARHLGMDTLSPEPTLAGAVYAAAVTPVSSLRQYLRLRLKTRRAEGASRLFAALAENAPGVRDTLMMGKVVFEAMRGLWDLVVVDSPPIGQVLPFLESPSVIGGLAPRGRIAEEAATIERFVRDREATRVLILAAPEELPVNEALALLRELDARTISASSVANLVIPSPGFEREQAERAPDPDRRTAGLLHLDLVEAQMKQLQRLAPASSLPFLFGTSGPESVSQGLAAHLGAL